MTSPRILLRVISANMWIEFRVNDIPVARYAPGEALNGAEVPLNEFLLERGNSIKMLINAKHPPSTANEGWGLSESRNVRFGAPANIQAEVLRFNDFTRKAEAILARFEWAGIATQSPHVQQQSFDADIALPRWAWTRARKLTQSDHATAFRALKQLWELLQRRDVSTLASLLRLKLEEVAEGAYGVPAEQFREGFVSAIGRVFSEPNWKLLPCGERDVEINFVADGRLAECLRPNGSPALTFIKPNSPEEFSLTVMLGEVDGRWKVLR